MNELHILKEIVNNLPSYNPGTIHDNVLEMDTLSGTAYAIGLCNCKEIAVAKTTLSEGCVLDAHYHVEKEIVVVFDGSLRIWENVTSTEDTQDDSFVELKAGDIFIIEPGVSHVVESPSGCKMIVMTIPAAKHFPETWVKR